MNTQRINRRAMSREINEKVIKTKKISEEEDAEGTGRCNRKIKQEEEVLQTMSGETMRWIARKETKSMRRNSEGERRGYRGVCM